ncbi:hypothetical protein PHLCEN_2v9734 [Hermanssonia centrifuga]|uniref:Uncharacterized protein n=1 Tax=Hermanssonia centrifuga TaxID=98765 RepID=A0A2R6NPV8_9APHY|nr:hypothetical protein PHLCEN_2v9734 [Hermanssonia centrifuga]
MASDNSTLQRQTSTYIYKCDCSRCNRLKTVSRSTYFKHAALRNDTSNAAVYLVQDTQEIPVNKGPVKKRTRAEISTSGHAADAIAGPSQSPDLQLSSKRARTAKDSNNKPDMCETEDMNLLAHNLAASGLHGAPVNPENTIPHGQEQAATPPSPSISPALCDKTDNNDMSVTEPHVGHHSLNEGSSTVSGYRQPFGVATRRFKTL